MENLNAENITNEIQSLIKALKDCGGWVKRGNGEGWFNHEILEDALALITSQEQRIKELTEEVASWKAIAEGYQKQFEDCAEDRAKLTEENERLRKNLETFKGKQKTLQKQKDVLANENHMLLSKAFDITVGACRIVFSNGEKGNIYTFTEKDKIAKEMLEGKNNGS